ncbi:hypothetical protein HRbin40_01416 [bacterium HR40]|nr:hypothetical protein HRbin40_01416 [bacterium HR40]
MKPARHRASHGLLAALLASATSVTAAAAGIDTRPQPKPGGQLAIEAERLDAVCFQQGSKIFEAGGFRAVDLGSVLSDASVRLKREGGQGAAVLVVPVADAVCIVTAR